jgi:hypothetical protein
MPTLAWAYLTAGQDRATQKCATFLETALGMALRQYDCDGAAYR